MHERHVDFARNRKRTFFQRTHFDIFPQRGEKSLNTVRSNLSRKRKKKKKGARYFESRDEVYHPPFYKKKK